MGCKCKLTERKEWGGDGGAINQRYKHLKGGKPPQTSSQARKKGEWGMDSLVQGFLTNLAIRLAGWLAVTAFNGKDLTGSNPLFSPASFKCVSQDTWPQKASTSFP